jgi:2-methylcitrate dehydratase PrpD
MTTASESLAAWVCALDPMTLPSSAIHSAKRCVLDGIGVALAGADTPWVEHVLAVARAQESRPRARVFGHPDRLSAALAALVNGTAVHALDYDDDPAACHIGAVVIPAALAMAELAHASSLRFLAAVIAGYDVTTRIGEAVDSDQLYLRGFHPTAVCGVFGAAAAAAFVLGLDAATTTHALGIAGSFSSGNQEFLAEGAMTKRLQAGKASHDGVMAAQLAKVGLSGPRSVLDGRYGLWRYTESLDAARFTRALGERWVVGEVFVKKHASCLGNAPALDRVLEILREEKLEPHAITEIRLGVRPSTLTMIGEPRAVRVRPQTMLDAQMSLPFSLAVAMIDGEAGIGQFAPKRLRDPAVLAIADRIHAYAHPDLVSAKAGDLTCYLDLTTHDGRRFSERLVTYRGHPDNPMTDEEMETKFRRCAGRRLSERQVDAAVEAIWGLDKLADLEPLLAAVEGSHP